MSSATVIGVSVARGVFNPLVGKLTKLLGEEYKKLTGVRKQATWLKDELSTMKALLIQEHGTAAVSNITPQTMRPGYIKIKTVAVALNPTDMHHASSEGRSSGKACGQGVAS